MSDRTASAEASREGLSAVRRAIGRWLPPARALWIGVLVLGGYGLSFFGTGLGLLSLVAFPAASVIVDLAFQRLRFESLRFPDAAIATGALLAVILPPDVPVLAGIVVVLLALSVRHIVRIGGRPLVNPAALAVVFGAVFLSLSPAWWGSIDETLVLGVGAFLLVVNRAHWRVPVVFLGAFAGLAILQHEVTAALNGAAVPPSVLLLSAVDPSMLFFGLFLVPEPRSGPRRTTGEPLYAVAVAAGTALGPWVFPTLAPFVALLGVNLGTGLLRARPWVGPSSTARSRPSASALRPVGVRWSLPARATAALLVLVVVGVLSPLAVPSNAPHPSLISSGGPIGPVSSGAAQGNCQSDNPSIPSGTLTALHKALGPSVILSDNPSNGVVVFYDPVHQVTVTETDMYEDFGFAEFNGDDATAAGCSP